MVRNKLLTVAVVVAVCGSLVPAVAVAGPTATDASADDWTASQGDAQNTNANDADGPTGPNATVARQFPDGGAESDIGRPSVPAVVNGTAYVGYDDSGSSATYVSKGRVIAYDTASGEVEWNQSDIPGFTETPTVADGYVYVTSSGDGADTDDDPANQTAGVYALNATTGEIAWTRTGSDAGNFVVSDGRMYVETGANLTALNASTGETVWTRPAEQDAFDMAVDDGTLVRREGGPSGNETTLRGVNASTGDVRWNATLTGTDTFDNYYVVPERSTVSAADGTAYLTVGDRTLSAVSLDDGSIEWERTVTNEKRNLETQWLSPPAVKHDTVYVSTLHGSDDGDNSTVFALNATTGETEWQAYNDAKLFAPTVSNDTVFLPAEQVTVEGQQYGSAPRDGVFALDATSGEIRWTYALPGLAHSSRLSAAPAEGALYVRTTTWDVYSDDGRVYALESTANATPADSRFILQDDPRTKPFVSIETDPANAGDRDLDAGTNVTLTADASDPDGDVTTIEWDGDEDGEFEQSGESITVPLNYCGTLTVTVRVTDDSGETAVESVELTT
ncbi:PQQ-like beta-propeller repeat protein [Halomicroarcula sp. S1AR25-4]|uniref:PQQ-like beta-propeller repeat protein n=1 Tax=Haloarcula sp. S1AR25-4 TaxID=2950538 RepID=UPI00287459D1|nr:PQQ-binding-like beta-propeller repeat protein [Halomicroarcula sp. S1AR25-4]MDS0278289.1 PQQ-like beta-propeller repeat protein [Halomicroarcula sp. S1AR25-4]